MATGDLSGQIRPTFENIRTSLAIVDRIEIVQGLPIIDFSTIRDTVYWLPNPLK